MDSRPRLAADERNDLPGDGNETRSDRRLVMLGFSSSCSPSERAATASVGHANRD
uniref:Uncharacterized protein n=1 Tax=Picea glauca TaxID=3330 RepID=A0A101M4R4_PICGL|nr:hypothetical protein ABT39_MTgene649 [Picea glauca]QHR87021.1 hypothetical protein Q903MT_gene1030 [Picea sitchensis]